MAPSSNLSKSLLDEDKERQPTEQTLVEGCPGCRCAHLQRPGAPLPWGIILITANLMLCNTLPVQILYPYMYFMVEDFGLEKPQIGTYAGFLASSFLLGRFMTSIPWGMISDRYGRKPVMVYGMISLLVFNTWFGLTDTYWMAFTTRLLYGLFSGLLGALAAYAAEICSMEHRAFSLSMLSTMWGVGLVVGPALGGYLSQPARRYTFLEGTVFDRYPYLLPPLVVSVYGLLCTLLIFWMPETLHKHEESNTPSQSSDSSSRSSLLRSYPFWSSNNIFCMWAFEEMVYNETFSLFAVSPSGLKWSSQEVGSVLAVTGVFLLVFMLFIYPVLARQFYPISLTRWSAILVLPLYIVYPLLPRLPTGVSAFVLVSLVSVLRVCLSGLVTSSSFLLVNNSVTQAQRGTATGINTSLVSAVRALGPSVGGFVFSFSQSRQHASILPGNQLLYFFLGAMSLFVVVGTWEPLLPSSTNIPVPDKMPLFDAGDE